MYFIKGQYFYINPEIKIQLLNKLIVKNVAHKCELDGEECHHKSCNSRNFIKYSGYYCITHDYKYLSGGKQGKEDGSKPFLCPTSDGSYKTSSIHQNSCMTAFIYILLLRSQVKQRITREPLPVSAFQSYRKLRDGHSFIPENCILGEIFLSKELTRMRLSSQDFIQLKLSQFGHAFGTAFAQNMNFTIVQITAPTDNHLYYCIHIFYIDNLPPP